MGQPARRFWPRLKRCGGWAPRLKKSPCHWPGTPGLSSAPSPTSSGSVCDRNGSANARKTFTPTRGWPSPSPTSSRPRSITRPRSCGPWYGGRCWRRWKTWMSWFSPLPQGRRRSCAPTLGTARWSRPRRRWSKAVSGGFTAWPASPRCPSCAALPTTGPAACHWRCKSPGGPSPKRRS